MNPKITISKAINSVLFSAAMLFVTTSAFAQVKIGTNPTVIDPASNLEVEASLLGNKVSINKTTGKVTIADGSQGVNRVLTSDPNGVATWEIPKEQNTDVWVYAKQTGTQSIAQNVITTILFPNEIQDRGVNYNPANGTITVPTAGIYQLSAGVQKTSDVVGYFNMVMRVYVNGSLLETIYDDSWPTGAENPRASASLTIQLNANDNVNVRLVAAFNPYSIGNGYLTFIKLSK